MKPQQIILFECYQWPIGLLTHSHIIIDTMNNSFKVRSHFIAYMMGFLTAISSFVATYSHVFLSQLEKVIKLKGDMTQQQISVVLSIIVSATFLGEVIGPFMYKSLIEKYGESGAMIRCYFVIIIAVLIQLIDLRFAFLLASRLLLGIVTGIQASILPLYLNSVSPVSMSGKIGSLNQLLTCYGVVVAYFLGFFVEESKEDQFYWRMLVGFPILPSLVGIVSLKWIFPYDSIERLISRNDTAALQAYTKQIYQDVMVEEIALQKMPKKGNYANGQYKKQFKRYILALVVVACNPISGINSIFYYAKQLFQDITDDDSLSQKLMLGLAVCQLLACISAGRFIDTYGRKFLILRGQLAVIIILVVIYLTDNTFESLSKDITHYLLIALIYIHVIVFNFTLGPICILYAAELVTNITPIVVTKRILCLLAAASTNYLIHEYGIGPMFLLYGVLSLVAYYYLKDRLRQTKGKSKMQILEMFQTHISDCEPEENTLFI